MSYVGIPQALESVALKLIDAAERCRALGQAMRREDLDPESPRAMCVNALKSTIKCQQELLGLLEPKKAKGKK